MKLLPPDTPLLPPDDTLRRRLHDEVHARPTARIRLPALVLQIAVLNETVTLEDELSHLRRLPGHQGLQADQLAGSFLRLRLPQASLRWERHTEMTRYSLVQVLPDADGTAAEPLAALAVAPAWLRAIPGRTLCAVELLMVEGDIEPAPTLPRQARPWFGERTLVASVLGRRGHSCAITDFQIRDTGFERVLVVAPAGTSETRVGRIAARLLELEAYRLLALRGLPVAKALQPMLAEAEGLLAGVTSSLDERDRSDPELLDTLAALAARVERATAQNGYRFAATAAYQALVNARIAELRETALPGTQTIGEFMQRRFSPAMATVAATAERLTALSQRIERAGALLRTRVDIAHEQQNQQLLARLSAGQQMQLRLQGTVEGLSIAAISYYVVSLLLYIAKAAKAAGAPLHPELAAGALVPLVLWGVWRLTRRIHARLGLGA